MVTPLTRFTKTQMRQPNILRFLTPTYRLETTEASTYAIGRTSRAVIQVAGDILTKWKPTVDRIHLFGKKESRYDSAPVFFEHLFASRIQPNSIRRIALTNMELLEITPFLILSSLDTLELVNCHSVDEFFKTMAEGGLQLTSFTWVKHTPFRKSAPDHEPALLSFLASLKLLRRVCIQIPPDMEIAVSPWGQSASLSKTLPETMETVSFRTGQTFDRVHLITGRQKKLISLGVDSSHVSDPFKVGYTGHSAFREEMKNLAAVPRRLRNWLQHLENLSLIGPLHSDRPMGKISAQKYLHQYATIAVDTFAAHHIKPKTVTIEMRAVADRTPLGLRATVRHFRVEEKDQVREVFDLSKDNEILLRKFGAGMERRLEDCFKKATRWDPFEEL